MKKILFTFLSICLLASGKPIVYTYLSEASSLEGIYSVLRYDINGNRVRQSGELHLVIFICN